MAITLNGSAAEVLNRDPLVIKNQKNWYHIHSYGGWGKFFTGLLKEKLLATRCTNPECQEQRTADEAHHVIDMQPFIGIALTPSCDLQAYIELKSRTSSYEVRTGDYETHPLSVFLTIRKYWGFSDGLNLADSHRQLADHADELSTERVVPLLVNPLAHAIASRS